MERPIIIKLGGSLLSPYETAIKQVMSGALPFDFEYAKQLISILAKTERQVVILVGGGFINRWYLRNIKQVLGNIPDSTNDLHTIGIASAVINASVFKILLQETLTDKGKVYPDVVKFGMYDDIAEIAHKFKESQFLIAAGWKPGHSHDLDAVKFAEIYGVNEFYSLKNIDGVYTADPSKDPNAKRIAALSWDEYFDIIKAHTHEPGANFPVDPIAAEEAKEKGMACYVMSGKTFEEIERILSGMMTTEASRIG